MSFPPLDYTSPNALNDLIKRVVELRQYLHHLNTNSFDLPVNDLDSLYKYLAEFDMSIEQVDWTLANEIFKIPVQDNEKDVFVQYVKFSLYELLLIDHEKKIKQRLSMSQICIKMIRYTLMGIITLITRMGVKAGYELVFKKKYFF